MVYDTYRLITEDFNALREMLGKYAPTWETYYYEGSSIAYSAASHFHHFMGNVLATEFNIAARNVHAHEPLGKEQQHLTQFVERVTQNKARFGLLRDKLMQREAENGMPPELQARALTLLEQIESHTLALCESIKARYAGR